MQKGGWSTTLLGLFVLGYIFVFLTIVHGVKIFDYYRVSDDVRQQIYPLYLARDGELFKNDALTRYFLSHTPPFYFWAHYPLAWLIDPVILSKLMQFGLLALVLVILYRIGRKLHGPWLGWCLIFICVHSPDVVGLTDGGLPRGWAVPGTVVFIWAVLENRVGWALAAVTVSGLFYPPIFLVLGPAYVLWCLVTRRFTYWNILALVLIVIGFWPMVFRGDDIGKIVTLAEATKMPEWQQGSRFPFVPIPSLRRLAPPFLAVSWVPGKQFGVVAWLMLAIGAASVVIPFLKKANSEPVKGSQEECVQSQAFSRLLALGGPLILSLVMYHVSRLLAFRLHIPDRNLKYTLPVLGLILITAGLYGLLELVFKSSRLSRFSVLIPALVITAAFLVSGNGFRGNLNLWADQRFAWKVYAFAETLPKTSLLAGTPSEMDNFPLFSRRTVYVSDEAVQPLYDRYYAGVAARVKTLYAAYYATYLQTVAEFAKKTGVTHMVVRKEDFGFKFNRARYYFEPYNSYVKALKGDKRASEFFFANPPSSSIVYEDGHFRVIDLRALNSRRKRPADMLLLATR